MNKTVMLTSFALRIAGVGALALGLALWSGRLVDWLGLHMALGLVVVLAVWTLSAFGLLQENLRGRAALLFVLGLAVLGLGVTQTGLLPGPAHRVIRAIHLLLGLGALGLGEILAKRLRMSVQRATKAASAASS
jgi:hypothetical protein